MGWCVIGRGIVLSLLTLAVGCTSGIRARASAEPGPRGTLVRVYEAVVRGDEAEYRRLVELPSGDAYSDALTTTMFESVRLYQAVERTSSSRPFLAAVDYRENARAMLKAVEGWAFTVKGDHATIDHLAGRAGAPTFRRAGDRWMLVPPPWDTSADTATYRLMVESERRLARALSTARAAVVDGRAKSVEDVNAILRKLLAEPATRP
jgi:hypothetical protein